MKNKKMRKRIFNKNEAIQFATMFLITYAITIIMAIIIAYNHFDAEIEKCFVSLENTKNNNLDWKSIFSMLDGKLSFYDCHSLSPGEFVLAKIAETLVPTTITFAGTILVQQVTENAKQITNTLLFCVIVILTLVGMSTMEVYNIELLNMYTTIVIVSTVLCLIFSFGLYAYKDSKLVQVSNHKRELSDGIMNRG